MKEIKLSNGNTLRITQDEYHDDSPRGWDNITKIVAFHNRYNLGDNHEYNSKNYNSWDELKRAIIKKEKPLVIEPLYLYDHSGITISTKPFPCPWDSGQLGFVYITKEGVDLVGASKSKGESKDAYKERLLDQLKGEVETYDQFLRGDVYMFQVLDPNGDCVDSCSGFYGDDPFENGMEDYVEGLERIDEVSL